MSKYIKQYNSFLEESIRIEKFLWNSLKPRDQAEVIQFELLYQTPTVIATLTGLHNWQQREYIKAKARHVGFPLPGLSSYADKQVVFDNAYLNYKLITSIRCNTDYPPDATTADKIGVSKDSSSSIEINESSIELPKLSPERIRELEAETDRMIGKPTVVKKSAYWVPPKEETASEDVSDWVPPTEGSLMSFPTHRRLSLPLPSKKSTTPSSREEFSTLIQDLSESKQENAAVWLSEQDERTPEEYQAKYNELTNPTTREEFYAMIQDLSDYKQEKAIIWLSEQDERTPEEYQAKYKELTTKLSIPRLPPRLPLIKRAGVASGR